MNTSATRLILLGLGACFLATLVPYAFFLGVSDTRSLFNPRFGLVPEPFVRFTLAHVVFWAGSWGVVGLTTASRLNAFPLSIGGATRLLLLASITGLGSGVGMSLLFAFAEQSRMDWGVLFLLISAWGLLSLMTVGFGHFLSLVLGGGNKGLSRMFSLSLVFWALAAFLPVAVFFAAIVLLDFVGPLVFVLPVLALAPAYWGLSQVLAHCLEGKDQPLSGALASAP